MRKEATIEQWDGLYKVTMNIKRLEPWNYLGRVKTLYVRDEYISDILSDLCSRVNIELRESQKLPSIDKFVDSINGGMF